MLKKNYLEDLNESQRLAVNHLEGPMMVIAGAGSGKTRVLTYRIVHLMANKVDPFRILALTFTNKAAREMKDRISNIVGSSEGSNLWMGTFHSVFARILRYEADKIGYPSNFTIYDTADSKNLIKAIIKENAMDDKIYKPGLVYNRISGAKNNLISPQAYLQNSDIQHEDRQSGREKLGILYEQYALRCFKAGAMDFDDLLFQTNVLLRDFPEVLHKYQSRFSYILVDEYQDTNYSQYLIVKKLAARNENLCVVGDDAQSIYGFRGANIQNILNFKKDYPDYGLYKLEQNYRSTQTIVEAANSVIEKNKDQIEKVIWTSNPTGSKIKVIKTYSDNEEGKIVVQDIYSERSESQASCDSFAILYRTNAQSRSFEEELRKLNIPYKIYGGLSFYQRKEIKDLLAYFRLICNPADEEAFKRIINYPARGIGNTTIDKIILTANQTEKSLWEVISNPNEFRLPINKGTSSKIENFVTMITRFQSELEHQSAYDLGYEIAKHTQLLGTLYQDKSPEGVSRYENIQELINGLKGFSELRKEQNESNTLSEFLLDVALLTDADSQDENEDHVSLMTIHQAKGLEFPYVFVVGMEENLFPSQLSLSTRADLEEERRLFYVALTRAKKKVQLSFASSRFRWGNLIYCEPSRFIEEIDAKFLDLPREWDADNTSFGDSPKSFTREFPQRSNKKRTEVKSEVVVPTITGKKLKRVNAIPREAGTADSEKLQVGMQVLHQKFGKGKVLKVEGNPPNVKATVFFPNFGQKQLLLKYARLEIV